MNKAHTTGYIAPVGRYVPPVLFNPYTGEPRDARDIASDPRGVLIVPPGARLAAASTPAAAPVVLPEPDAVINEVMELVKDWAQRDLIAVEAGIDTLDEESSEKQHQEAKRLDGEAETAYRAIEAKLRALLAGVSAPAAMAMEPLDIVQAAADAASVGHLSHLIDHQSQILARAMAAMKAVELTASPIDEPHGDLDARIPYEAWATFVDARAALLYDVKRSPVAAPQAQKGQ